MKQRTRNAAADPALGEYLIGGVTGDVGVRAREAVQLHAEAQATSGARHHPAPKKSSAYCSARVHAKQNAPSDDQVHAFFRKPHRGVRGDDRDAVVVFVLQNSRGHVLVKATNLKRHVAASLQEDAGAKF